MRLSKTTRIQASSLFRPSSRLSRLSRHFNAPIAMSPPPEPAPWKPLFTKHITAMKSPEFVLSTVSQVTTASGQTRPEPRARYCVFRGFFASHSPDYDSDLIALTTDIRMEKVSHLFPPATPPAALTGSGGGGPVEAVWWVNKPGDGAAKIMTQWRIRGDAFVLAADIDSDSPQAKTTRDALLQRMTPKGGESKGEWSFAREVDAVFASQSAGIKGSFRGPPPGQPVDRAYDEAHLKLGSKLEEGDPEADTARANFRVVVIRPSFAEATDLSEPTKARRQKYYYDEQKGGWRHEETWP